ncbi:hypothetical protein QR680_001877 [Steinernema hermaphroditum]|uniref:Uncharacterized protein n=1 Tax=Steinernema hermaphroditum TaxID=289476 RepID=A0AA39LH28_9BILA|nr:hypothetical protein QR680_001877 [Steinernema hermaphroditum]
MRRLLRFLLLPLCLISFLAAAEEAGTPPPHVVMAQRLLSNLPNIPNAIQEGMEGKHGEIRKMVSNVLGDGLISQLVVNPMSLASQFGIDLDQFGINKTLTEQVLGTGAESNVKKQAVPNTLSTGEQGEKIWSSDKGFKKDKQTNEESEKEPLYVNGHLVNEEEFRESLDNEMRIRPNRPALVQEKPTETSTTTTSTLPTTTTKNPQEKMAEKVLNALGKSLFSSDYTSTPSAPVIPSVTAGNDQIVVEPEYKWDSVDPRRLAEVSNLLRRAPPQPAMPPAMPPSSFGGLTQEADLPSSTADSVFSYFKNRELSSLTPEEFELTKEARKVQEQLRKQLDKWHNSFNPNSDEPSSPLNDFSSDSMTLKTSIEQAIPPVTEQPAIKSPGRSVSGLQNQLRYSPEIRRKPQKQPLFNESEFTSNCECVEVDFERMKGVWMQSLAAPLALDMQYRSVGRVFGTDDSIPLNCSSISLGRPQQSEAAQDARITWTFRTENSRKLFRLSGTVLTMDHRTIRVQFNDYNGGKTHFPVCALKTSYTSDGPYDYIVLVEANTCKSASLLVRDPETFFDNDNTELIHFLQHKVRSNELDEMDVVPHEGVCSDE